MLGSGVDEIVLGFGVSIVQLRGKLSSWTQRCNANSATITYSAFHRDMTSRGSSQIQSKPSVLILWRSRRWSLNCDIE